MLLAKKKFDALDFLTKLHGLTGKNYQPHTNNNRKPVEICAKSGQQGISIGKCVFALMQVIRKN